MIETSAADEIVREAVPVIIPDFAVTTLVPTVVAVARPLAVTVAFEPTAHVTPFVKSAVDPSV